MRSNSFSSRDAIYSRDTRRKKNCRLYDMVRILWEDRLIWATLIEYSEMLQLIIEKLCISVSDGNNWIGKCFQLVIVTPEKLEKLWKLV